MSREKQIDIDLAVEEMASAIREITVKCCKCEYYKDGSCLKPIDMGCDINEDILNECDALYNAGCRKQSEGEWIDTFGGDDIQRCSVCNHMFYYPKLYKYHFCPNCGAKMKGGAE